MNPMHPSLVVRITESAAANGTSTRNRTQGKPMTDEAIKQQPDLITAAEIARMCRAEERTVTDTWAYKPDFPRPYKPGKVRLWDRREILRWLEKRRRGA